MPTWRKKASQARSKETEEALAHSARELLSTRSFSDIRVDEVARHAGISVGGFYARFNGKSALLHLADIDFLDGCVAAFDAVIPEEFEGNLDQLLRAFITVMVQQFDKHRDTIIQIMKHAPEEDVIDFRQRATEFNTYVHGRMRAKMALHVADIAHQDPAIAINMTIFIASAAARAAVLQGALSTYPIALNLDELIEELVSNALRYLKGNAE
ncbi:MAG: TetR/AcrR family transcriptional regulator [Rhodothermaceae bacterium]|nr:TetR/AcrR family transcriptional regulator [Rhodothermaceae bacterium]